MIDCGRLESFCERQELTRAADEHIPHIVRTRIWNRLHSQFGFVYTGGIGGRSTPMYVFALRNRGVLIEDGLIRVTRTFEPSPMSSPQTPCSEDFMTM